MGGKPRAPARTIAEPTGRRAITPPDDFAAALRRVPEAQESWDRLSYSHKREHVEAIEEAVRAGTRVRRIAKAIAMLRAR